MIRSGKLGITLAIIQASFLQADAASPTVASFPLYPDQQWFSKESYLYWKPFQADIDYGVKSNTVEETDFVTRIDTTTSDIKTKKPKFHWNSGVRIALGKYLSQHDSWDVTGAGTYYYGNGSDKSHAFAVENDFFTPLFFPGDLNRFVSPETNKVNWHLNYYTVDLALGREFSMTPHLVIHPYFGIRTALIYQDYINNGHGEFIDDVETQTVRYQNHIKNNFWGVGPRVGADFAFEFTTHWSILGNLSGAFFWGQANMKEKFRSKELTVSLLAASRQSASYRLKDKDQVVRTNIEGSIGLGWEQWVNNNKVRLAPSIVFESSIWFSMNQLPQLNHLGSKSKVGSALVEAERRHGDLGLIGATFNFQVDF